MQVITLEVKKLQVRLSKKNISITLSDSAKNFLVEKGFEPTMGARPLRRTIEQYLEDPLAEKLLHHPNQPLRSLVTVENGELIFVDEVPAESTAGG